MLPLALTIAAVLACRPAEVDQEGEGLAWGGETPIDTGSGAHDGSSTPGTLPGDDPVETIPGADPTPEGLCQVTLDCGGAHIPDEDRISCRLTVMDDAGHVYWDSYAGVETRGRSSLSAPKHQYSVELWDADGTDVEANLLGMGDEADWVLNGNYYDRALIRNPLAYDLFRAAGDVGDVGLRYAAEHRYCQLTLDGRPQGIYSLMEKVKRDDDRIDLPADDGNGSSFVIKLHDSDYMRANSLGYGGWKLIYPKDADATQIAGISAWLAGWEQAALYDPASLESWVDVDAAIDVILLQELMKNNDGYYLSLHAHKAPGGALQLMPWDLDLTLGQPDYNDNENPFSWILYRPTLAAAFQDVPDFDARLAARWLQLRAGPWATDEILGRIDAYQDNMGEAAIEANFEIWPIGSIDFSGYLYDVDSYAEEDAAVRTWVETRADWMDDNVARWSQGP